MFALPSDREPWRTRELRKAGRYDVGDAASWKVDQAAGGSPAWVGTGASTRSAARSTSSAWTTCCSRGTRRSTPSRDRPTSGPRSRTWRRSTCRPRTGARSTRATPAVSWASRRVRGRSRRVLAKGAWERPRRTSLRAGPSGVTASLRRSAALTPCSWAPTGSQPCQMCANCPVPGPVRGPFGAKWPSGCASDAQVDRSQPGTVRCCVSEWSSGA